MQSKPGYLTTEFWLSLLATVLVFAQSSGLMPDRADSVVAWAISALAALGYTAGRSYIKGREITGQALAAREEAQTETARALAQAVREQRARDLD